MDTVEQETVNMKKVKLSSEAKKVVAAKIEGMCKWSFLELLSLGRPNATMFGCGTRSSNHRREKGRMHRC